MIRVMSIGVLAAVWLVAACSRNVEYVIIGVDAGDAGTGGAVDAFRPVPDAGPPAAPLAGSECDQQDDCNACTGCTFAAFQPCNERALACEDDAACLGLAMCLDGCPEEDDACVRGCAEAHPGGRAMLRGVYQCALCDACPADCTAYHATWCGEPPF